MDDDDIGSSEEDYSDSCEEGEEIDYHSVKMLFPSHHPGSSVMACQRLSSSTSMLSSKCKIDKDLPRLSCGHIGVPTKDVAIQGIVIYTMAPNWPHYHQCQGAG